MTLIRWGNRVAHGYQPRLITLSLPIENEGQRSFVARQALSGDTDMSAGAAIDPHYKVGISSVVSYIEY